VIERRNIRQNLQRQNVPPNQRQNLQRQNQPRQDLRGPGAPGLQQRGGVTPPILRQLPGTRQPALLPGGRGGPRVPGVRQPRNNDLR